MEINTETYEIRVWSWFDDDVDFSWAWADDCAWIGKKFYEYAEPAEVIDIYLATHEIGYTIKWNGCNPSSREINSACHKTTIEYLKHKGVLK